MADDHTTKNQESSNKNQAAEEPINDKAEGAKTDVDSQLSEESEAKSESAEASEGSDAGVDQPSQTEAGGAEEGSTASTAAGLVSPRGRTGDTEATGPAETEPSDQSNTTDKPTPKKAAKPVSKELEKIIEQIEKLSVLELADLVHALEDRFGVTAAAPVAIAPVGAGQAAGEEAASEQTTFNVILASAGANKIGVIKAVRELVQTLGLKEAKDLVEAAPKPVLEGVNKETANEAKTKLTAAGATVELQ